MIKIIIEYPRGSKSVIGRMIIKNAIQEICIPGGKRYEHVDGRICDPESNELDELVEYAEKKNQIT